MLNTTQIQFPHKSITSYISTTISINYHVTYLVLDLASSVKYVFLLLIDIIFFDLHIQRTHFFFGKLTYVLKEEDTNIIRGIPQIYNDNRNIKQQMATG
jgi:hypothetical protein